LLARTEIFPPIVPPGISIVSIRYERLLSPQGRHPLPDIAYKIETAIRTLRWVGIHGRNLRIALVA
jgi:hypothetical protein